MLHVLVVIRANPRILANFVIPVSNVMPHVIFVMFVNYATPHVIVVTVHVKIVMKAVLLVIDARYVIHVKYVLSVRKNMHKNNDL